MIASHVDARDDLPADVSRAKVEDYFENLLLTYENINT